MVGDEANSRGFGTGRAARGAHPIGSDDSSPSRNPIQLVVNYWEIRPAAIGAKLDELIHTGIHHIASFVPWQGVESDISHCLPRFLQAAADRKLGVTLILTPEVGVHYPNSGLPKDLLNKPEISAKLAKGGSIPIGLPPNSFPLPSISAPEFTKRYHNFLTRLDNTLADLSKNQPNILKNLTAVLTGSFWKYYRGPQPGTDQAFAGASGDFSTCAAVAYRQRVDQHFAQREFVERNPSSGSRWKTRQMEEVNRRWFYQQSEDVFRARSAQFLRKKAIHLDVQHFELFTPEADPSLQYSNFLSTLLGSKADFRRYSTLLDLMVSRTSIGDAGQTAPFVHWTELGGFRTLTDSEKQFLILKSLLLMGGRGGGILIDEAEWFALSANFRSRVESLSRLIGQGQLKLESQAVYYTSHLWSGSGTLWDELHSRLGCRARQTACIDLISAEANSRLVIVDPTVILTRDAIEKLSALAKHGKVVVLPRSSLYSDAAREALERFMHRNSKGMEIKLGVAYRVEPMGEGKLVVYDLPEGLSMQGEALSAWKTFLSSLFSLANLPSECHISDPKLSLIPLLRKDGGMGLFTLNGTSRPVAADLVFSTDVSISDLSSAFVHSDNEADATAPADRYSLEVPPFGVLPMAVDGLGEALAEKRAAAITSDVLRENAAHVASNELPGFSPNDSGIEAVWN